MEPVTARVTPAKPGYGYMNRILKIDLSTMKVSSQESEGYLPEFLGGRGLAAKIAWDEYPQPIDPFDPANPLMIFPGALTGTKSPYNGRTTVCSFSPQAYPHACFTRSNIGGWIGGNIKRAGYDGIIITGKADQPTRIRVVDDEVCFVPAADLWGVDALDTLEELSRLEGKKSKALTIGPAGERLSRIATIQTGTSSACGQGGFGVVMGAKNLKAISVIGTYEVKAAHPGGILKLTRQISKVARTPKWFGGNFKAINEEMAKEGGGKVRVRACTEGCVTPCQTEFRDMPGVVHKRKWSGDWICVAANSMMGSGRSHDALLDKIKQSNFSLDRHAAFEMNVLSNRYGLNQSDIFGAMSRWLHACQQDGLISELNGMAMDWNSPVFWDTFLHAVAYREGSGDALAEGGWRASKILGLGEELIQRFYPGWGQKAHWDGRTVDSLPFPFWISAALQWLSDTRDPFNSGHGSLRGMYFNTEAAATDNTEEREKIIAAARVWGKKIYGTEAAFDPYSGYEGKAKVGHFHTIRPIIKDCVPLDDFTFPLHIDTSAADYLVVLQDDIGNDIPGVDVEYHLFCLGTGVEWSKEQFDQAADRVHALERALQVRHWGRDRSFDEMVLPYFDQPESYQNPLLEQRHGLDRDQFKPVLDEFYSLHGWDPATGRPTKKRLEALGLDGVYEQMTAGANAIADQVKSV
jgi:aldehyde:ferredoxin oxidoreductase